jgi:hypothetical protein
VRKPGGHDRVDYKNVIVRNPGGHVVWNPEGHGAQPGRVLSCANRQHCAEPGRGLSRAIQKGIIV